MSSAIQIAFGTSARTLSSLSWNTSEAILRPNGSLSHLNLLYGVLNVIRRLLARSKGTCQYPEVASTMDIVLIFDSWGQMSSSNLM